MKHWFAFVLFLSVFLHSAPCEFAEREFSAIGFDYPAVQINLDSMHYLNSNALNSQNFKKLNYYGEKN